MEEKQLDIKLQFPRNIEIQTQSLCNANCKICPYEKVSRMDKVGGYHKFPLEIIYSIIDDASKYKEIEFIKPYMNNEPFLDNRIIDILRYIKNKGIATEISTNASCLDEELTRKIVDEQLVDDFRISFFSVDKEKYKELMPGLDYDRTLQRIQFFIDYNRKHNNIIPLQIVQVMYDGMNLDAEKKLLNMLFKGTQKHFFGYLDRAGNNDKKNSTILIEYPEATLRGCKLARLEETMTIAANGNVIICSQDWAQENVLGNIIKESLKDIITGNKRTDYLRQLYGIGKCSEDFLCKKCKLANIALKNSNDVIQNFKGDYFMQPDDKKSTSY